MAFSHLSQNLNEFPHLGNACGMHQHGKDCKQETVSAQIHGAPRHPVTRDELSELFMLGFQGLDVLAQAFHGT